MAIFKFEESKVVVVARDVSGHAGENAEDYGDHREIMILGSEIKRGNGFSRLMEP